MASAIDFLPTISSCQAVSQMNLATARWRPHAGYKETLGGCRECHGETPRHERLFEVTEVGADVRFVERDGLHRRRRFMSDVGGRAGAAGTFSKVRAWPFADLIL